jgi:hypothetical protein
MPSGDSPRPGGGNGADLVVHGGSVSNLRDRNGRGSSGRRKRDRMPIRGGGLREEPPPTTGPNASVVKDGAQALPRQRPLLQLPSRGRLASTLLLSALFARGASKPWPFTRIAPRRRLRNRRSSGSRCRLRTRAVDEFEVWGRATEADSVPLLEGVRLTGAQARAVDECAIRAREVPDDPRLPVPAQFGVPWGNPPVGETHCAMRLTPEGLLHSEHELLPVAYLAENSQGPARFQCERFYSTRGPCRPPDERERQGGSDPWRTQAG